jgi:hypothetical protein
VLSILNELQDQIAVAVYSVSTEAGIKIVEPKLYAAFTEPIEIEGTPVSTICTVTGTDEVKPPALLTNIVKTTVVDID